MDTKIYRSNNYPWYVDIFAAIVILMLIGVLLFLFLFLPFTIIGVIVFGILLFRILYEVLFRDFIYEVGAEGIRKINRFTKSTVFIRYGDITAVTYTWDKPITEVFGKDYYGKRGPIHKVEISSSRDSSTALIFSNKDVLLGFLDSIKPYVGEKIAENA